MSLSVSADGNIDTKEAFIVYAVYERPADYPDEYVLCKWVDLVPDLHPLARAKTLDEIHKMMEQLWKEGKIPGGLYNMGQDPVEPTLIETWI